MLCTQSCFVQQLTLAQLIKFHRDGLEYAESNFVPLGWETSSSKADGVVSSYVFINKKATARQLMDNPESVATARVATIFINNNLNVVYKCPSLSSFNAIRQRCIDTNMAHVRTSRNGDTVATLYKMITYDILLMTNIGAGIGEDINEYVVYVSQDFN